MLKGFTNNQIVSILGNHSFWSKRACREILSRRNEFQPLLLNILDEAIQEPEPFMYDDKDQHIPAALLLAQMKVPEAYPRLIELINYNEKENERLWGDLLTEYITRMFRDTYNGDSSLLPRFIENRHVCPWTRAMAVKAYGMHYFDSHISREEITGFYRN